ncbi:MAG: hypothetical protein MZV63_56495 [Marinilabiliales bacterium]|nr:hypothetical protein [Marinilabiliales bacterium]
MILEDAQDPAGEPAGARMGKGHKIAFNILNLGRLQAGAWPAPGTASSCSRESALYAQRSASSSGVPIAKFGAIKREAGAMFARTLRGGGRWATARPGLIDARVEHIDKRRRGLRRTAASRRSRSSPSRRRS